MAISPFMRAHYEKVELNKKTAKKIKRAYNTTAKDVKNRIALLNSQVGSNPSDSLKKLYLDGLLKDIDNSLTSLEKYVQTTITGAAEASGQLAIKASEEVMNRSGLSITGAYSYVPRQEVANILSGKAYGNNWSFSKALWGMDKKTKEDLEKIVARGLAENKPILDIAKSLEQYVDPSARKPWDWSKVYPGTTQKVDYNAQRLARTLIQHSFQNCMVQAQKDNPFCKGIIWHTVGLHGRTCEVCEAREGQTFPVTDLPLDHPNGMCYFEPALDRMDDIADRLADWTMGKEDPELDNYVVKAFNIDPTSGQTIAKIDQVKQDTRDAADKLPTKEFNAEAWLNKLKQQTDGPFLKWEDTVNPKLSPVERESIRAYSGNYFDTMNDALRDIANGKLTWEDLSDGLRNTINKAISGLEKVPWEKEIYLRRGSTLADLASLLDGDFRDNMEMLKDLSNYFKWADPDAAAKGANALNKIFEGTLSNFSSFTSTSSIWNRGFDGSVEYIFKAPPGTRGRPIMTLSKYQTAEGEFLLSPDAKIKVHKILPAPDGHKSACIRVFLEIIV